MPRRTITLSLLVGAACPSGSGTVSGPDSTATGSTGTASTTLATDATTGPITTGSAGSTSTTTSTSGPDPGPQDCALRAPVGCWSDEGMGDVACPPFCTNLVWLCNFPPRCEGLAVVGSEVVDPAPAVCAIEAMLAAEAAKIAFTNNGSVGALFVVGDGTAMIQWDGECLGDLTYSVRSGRLTLQPDFLSACLVAPTPASLAACLFDDNQPCVGESTWTPSWSTGEYSQTNPPGCVG